MQKKLIEVCYTPADYAYFKGKFEIVVVIDVLRATSAICSAINNGVNSVIPVSTIEEAKDYQKKGYLVGAERQGEIVEGFDFGNSPYSYMKPELKGKDIVLSTTNGTRAINIAKEAETVVIGALTNLDVLCEWLAKQDKNVVCLCSGWKDNFNLEDTICGGAIAENLLRTGNFASNEDSSVAAKYLYLTAKDNYFGFLKASSHRRRLKKLNLNEDIKFCLTPNQMDVIPVLRNDRIEKLKY
ncbi:2-phosphosulfolactate phosphatase [Brumimicrobium aurantiacum]|uniref:Probable 2-phosphosulfolactate phosphatase n=1 Tax=Brumimicrobium aurantiacum TaxID=1737063 RepID=A0A3E1F061_9FLAO|nr:2-phosphosulfolactate phosphatase [Brumimicrobium aurantiacum]RFC55206.1 2-phosphosulfolactate phosphatase [Brumimicrobium aurantiacum]